MLYTLPFVFLAVALLIYLPNFVRPRLRQIPGPIQGRLSSLYRIWMLLDGKGPINYAKLHERYGPVVRTGPNHVSISDSSLIPTIYDPKNRFLKSKFYDVFRPLYRGQPMDTVFTTQDVARNKRLKIALVKNLTGCPLLFQDEIQHSVDVFVQQMMNSQGQSVDLSYWAFFWSFDITYALLFGSHYGYMNSRADSNQWIYTFKTITGYAAILGQKPEWCSWTLANDRIMKLMQRLQPFPDPVKQFIEEVEKKIKFHDTTTHVCDKRFMCKVLSGRTNIGDADQHAEVVNILFETFFAAAAEIAVTLATVFYCLLNNSHAYQRLTREIRGEAQGCESQEATTWRNPYLGAVIKESLRLYSSNSPPMERVVPSSGLRAAGYHIPEGAIISVPQYVVHRDSDVYGEDAEVFRAERWLEADASTQRRMEQNFLAFGRGTRACVGRDLAMLEIRMLLVEVLRCFDVEFTTPEIPPKITMYWMLDHVGFNAIFTLRSLDKQHN